MTDKFPPLDSADANDLQQLETLLADGLAPIPVAGARRNSLRQGLMKQVTASLAKQAGLLTVRAGHGTWQALKTGIRVKPLWDGGLQGHSVLIEFAPSASLIAHRHNCLEEGIVLHGDLQMGDLRLGPLDYHAAPAGSRHGGISSTNGALAYLRGTSLGDNREVLREVLGGLLPFGKAESCSVFTKQIDDWQEIAPGVWKKTTVAGRGTRIQFLSPGSRRQMPGTRPSPGRGMHDAGRRFVYRRPLAARRRLPTGAGRQRAPRSLYRRWCDAVRARRQRLLTGLSAPEYPGSLALVDVLTV